MMVNGVLRRVLLTPRNDAVVFGRWILTSRNDAVARLESGVMGENRMQYSGVARWSRIFFFNFIFSVVKFFSLFLLFVLKQKVTKSSRLHLFAKKRKFLSTKFLNLRGNETCASMENYSRASDRRNFYV